MIAHQGKLDLGDGVKPRAVIVLSGGQDSTTCLFAAREEGYELHTITFDYGQRHRREVAAAAKISQMAGAQSHRVVHLRQVDGASILEGTSPLVSKNELQQYADHQSLPGGLEKTFVPMRNQLFLTIAANRAYVLGTNILFTGVCQEDFGGYPDCRRDFVDSLEKTSSLGTFTGDRETLPRLRIYTPLMFMTKAQSVKYALTLPDCYEALAFSHTSYDGSYPPTGHDHATLLRAKGFEEAGVPDPLVLRAWIEGLLDGLPKTDNYQPAMKIASYVERISKLAEDVDMHTSRR